MSDIHRILIRALLRSQDMSRAVYRGEIAPMQVGARARPDAWFFFADAPDDRMELADFFGGTPDRVACDKIVRAMAEAGFAVGEEILSVRDE